MGNVTTTDIVAILDSSTVTKINNNVHTVRDEFDKILYRDSRASLLNPMDANGQRIFNGGAPVNPTDFARLKDVTDYIGSLISAGSSYVLQAQRQEFIATLGQTAFAFTYNALAGYLDVFLNGVKLASSEYSFSTATITLVTPTALNDVVVISGFVNGATTTPTATFLQAGTGAISRSVQSKLTDIVGVKDFGVVGDASTNDSTAFGNAVTAATPAGALVLTSPTYVGTARPTLKGVQVLGNKPVVYDRGGVLGKSVVNRRGRDLGQKVLGRAYLFRFWVYLSQFGTAGTANIKMYGDSVTAGYVGPILQTMFGGVSGIGTVTNNAISGTTIEQWRTGTGAFAASGKALSDWIAAPTEVLYIAFGINTPYYGNSPTDFVTSLDAALATIRASRDVTTTSIVVVLPVASRDGGAMSIEGGWKRDEYFVYSLRELCEPLVDKYGICLFDPTVATPEADVDVSGVNIYNWLDTAGVHPQFGNKYFVAGEVFDAICPSSMRSVSAVLDVTATVTPATGFTLPGSENMRAIKRRELVVTDGYVGMTTPAALTVGQVIATIPASVNPSVYIRRVDLVLYNGAWETIRGEIDNSALSIKSGQVSVMAPTRVYLIGQWSTT